jgi:hypothetical protein
VNLKPFLVDALTSALDLKIGRPEDVLRHVTPDVLSIHLPRPLWARLITACLGAPKVDATLIVETIGVPNLCEHIPSHIIWACIADIAAQSLKKPEKVVEAPVVAAAPARPTKQPLTPPPPDAAPQPVRAASSGPAVAQGPAIPSPSASPLADIVAELEADLEKPATRRSTTQQRFRSTSTGINRPMGTAGVRRPQVQASAPPARTPVRRGETEVSERENETSVDGYGREIAVDDSQLVDWQSDGSTASGANDNDDDFGDIGRKR